MSLDRCRERAAESGLDMPWAGIHSNLFFHGKANVTMIKLQVGIENRVGGGGKRVLY